MVTLYHISYCGATYTEHCMLICMFRIMTVQALVGLNSRRKVYSVLRGAFNNDGITEYIRDMAGGRGRTTKYRGDSLPPVVTVEAWDGQDGEVSGSVK